MTKNTERFTQFRQKVYQTFNKRADSKMELLDALCSHENAKTPVELSLSAAFRRHYSGIYHAIADLKLEDEVLRNMAQEHLPEPSVLPFWLMGVDVTACPRPYGQTVSDRQIVHHPTAVPGQKPITLGHQYSTVTLIPSQADTKTPWVIPLSTRRVHSPEDKELVGSEQVAAIVQDKNLPFHDQLCVEVVDSAYSKPAYLHANRKYENLVTITRVRSNRVFYNEPDPTSQKWYGERFDLKDVASWRPPDETKQTSWKTARGRTYPVEIKSWHHMRMRGHRQPQNLPMQRHPFTLIQIQVWRYQGQLLFQRPLWLIVVGERRMDIALLHAYQAYVARSSLEHFFRFSKQRLLLHRYQTPDTTHEERWWRLVHLAYLQLWVARPLAEVLPRPWEKYLPAIKQALLSPRFVQRDFGRLLRQLGTPARSPKPRNRGSGRRQGQGRRQRTRYQWVKKSHS